MDQMVSMVDFRPLTDGGIYKHISPPFIPPWLIDYGCLSAPVVKDETYNDALWTLCDLPSLLSSIAPALSFIPPQIFGFLPFSLYQLRGKNMLFHWELTAEKLDSLRNRCKNSKEPPDLPWCLQGMNGLRIFILNEGDCVQIPGGSMWSLLTWEDSFYIRVECVEAREKTILFLRPYQEWLETIVEDHDWEGAKKGDDEDDGQDGQEHLHGSQSGGKKSIWIQQLASTFNGQLNLWEKQADA
jgi:hypothetical protein